jgi:hypothetical protein
LSYRVTYRRPTRSLISGISALLNCHGVLTVYEALLTKLFEVCL